MNGIVRIDFTLIERMPPNKMLEILLRYRRTQNKNYGFVLNGRFSIHLITNKFDTRLGKKKSKKSFSFEMYSLLIDHRADRNHAFK